MVDRSSSKQSASSHLEYPPLPNSSSLTVTNKFQSLAAETSENVTEAPVPNHQSIPKPPASLPRSYVNLFKEPETQRHESLKPIGTKEGAPAVFFEPKDKERMERNMKHTLIGKFSHDRPTLDCIRQLFQSLKIKGEFSLFLWDTKHLFIELSHKEDCRNLWRRGQWQMNNFLMRMIKWTPNFEPHKECPITPVWVTLPRLPACMYDEEALLSVANAIGSPLKVDMPMINQARFNACRVCIEFDVSTKPIDKIWISFGINQITRKEEGFWQEVRFGEMPKYCSECFHLGHD